MKGKVFAIAAIVLILGGCLAVGLNYLEGYDASYYTKIDNSEVRELSSDEDMKYEYALDCYNEDGKKRELKFKTVRQLRERAYLLLEVRALGVHKWEEVEYNDLPQKVQEKFE